MIKKNKKTLQINSQEFVYLQTIYNITEVNILFSLFYFYYR